MVPENETAASIDRSPPPAFASARRVGRLAVKVAYLESLVGVQAKRVPYNDQDFFRPVSPYVVPGDRQSGLSFGVRPPGPLLGTPVVPMRLRRFSTHCRSSFGQPSQSRKAM